MQVTLVNAGFYYATGLSVADAGVTSEDIAPKTLRQRVA